MFHLSAEIIAERNRIARDLHDTLLPSIEGLILKVYTATRRMRQDDPVRVILLESLDQAERLATEGRQRLLGLRALAPVATELSCALQEIGRELSGGTNTAFSSGYEGRAVAVASHVWDEAFSIAREAMSNAFKHASAKNIEVLVSYRPSMLAVRVSDDGRGISQSTGGDLGRKNHVGLRLMEERATTLHGRLTINSSANHGTTVTLAVPALIAYRDIVSGPIAESSKTMPGQRRRLQQDSAVEGPPKLSASP